MVTSAKYGVTRESTIRVTVETKTSVSALLRLGFHGYIS
jgi:hypothetical protein